MGKKNRKKKANRMSTPTGPAPRRPLTRNRIILGIVAIVIIGLFFIGYQVIALLTEKPPIEKPVPAVAYNKYEFKKEGTLTFLDSSGSDIITIDIELAETQLQRQRGLMYRDKLDSNQGMLFLFHDQKIQSFWMHNTILSLDIVFGDSTFTINTIHKNTRPFTDSSLSSNEPSKYVIEVNAGFTDQHGIDIGDKFNWTRLPE